MKQIIKKLAEEISDVLNQNAITNEMDALIDAGEWSQSGPDFDPLVKRWGLSADQVMGYIQQAMEWSRIFRTREPEESRRKRYAVCYFQDPWEERVEKLHCLFMAGSITPSERRTQYIRR